MNHPPDHPDKSPGRAWLPALLLWLAGSAALMAFVYLWFTPTFTARSQVKVETDNTTNFGAGTYQITLQQFMQSQAAMLASPTIIGTALAEHPELAATPMLKNSDDREYELSQALRVGIVPRTNFIQVEMSSPIPAEAARLVNAVVGAYLKHAQAPYDTSTRKRIELLRTTRDEQSAAVEKQRAHVLSLVGKLGPGPDRNALASLQSAYSDLRRAEAVLGRIEEALNQYLHADRKPTVRVELNFPATPSVRPDTARRRQLMAAVPLAAGPLVLGPLLLLRPRGARRSDP